MTRNYWKTRWKHLALDFVDQSKILEIIATIACDYTSLIFLGTYVSKSHIDCMTGYFVNYRLIRLWLLSDLIGRCLELSRGWNHRRSFQTFSFLSALWRNYPVLLRQIVVAVPQRAPVVTAPFQRLTKGHHSYWTSCPYSKNPSLSESNGDIEFENSKRPASCPRILSKRDSCLEMLPSTT